MKEITKWWICYADPNKPEQGIKMEPYLATPEMTDSKARTYASKLKTKVLVLNSNKIPSILDVVWGLKPK